MERARLVGAPGKLFHEQQQAREADQRGLQRPEERAPVERSRHAAEQRERVQRLEEMHAEREQQEEL